MSDPTGPADRPDRRAAVLFDVDGTLVDSTYHHAMAWFRAFRRHDVTLPVHRVHRTIGMGGDKLVAHVAGDDVEKELGDALREAWEEEYAAVVDQVPALPGASELCHRLAEDGFSVGLASSGKSRFTEVAVEAAGIGSVVAAQTSSDDAEESKPQPDILVATLDRLDVDTAVVVGDTPYDVEAAARLGLRCLAVLTGGFSTAELEEAGAVVVATDLTELVDHDWAQHLAPPRRS
ncbi:HAD family hydrolase [Nocardioides caldifontis]|uniref:HAD family hydrolase n=1 Tax=Nocardioides caldifontis TaxID=2588938 RepID=UPI0011DF5036|nr:HAD family hydrolase [Nocardioides caldifontis]